MIHSYLECDRNMGLINRYHRTLSWTDHLTKYFYKVSESRSIKEITKLLIRLLWDDKEK